MQTTVRLARVLCFCFTACFIVSCVSGKRQSPSAKEVFAKAVLASVQLTNTFNYDVVGVVPIRDASSPGKRWLCYLFGGPPSSTIGAVGVFDETGKLLDAKLLEGLFDYETNVTILGENDSVVLRVLDASGTGLHAESFVVLTVSGGKLLETFRCSGLSYSTHCEFYDQEVQLFFRDLYGDATPELIRLVRSNRYPSFADQENGKPSERKSTAEVFQFDSNACRYVQAFE